MRATLPHKELCAFSAATRVQVKTTDPRIRACRTITIISRRVSAILYSERGLSQQLIERSRLIFLQIGNGGLERLISSHVEVSKIDRRIAEEVLNLQRRREDSSSGSSPGPATETGLLNAEVNINSARGQLTFFNYLSLINSHKSRRRRHRRGYLTFPNRMASAATIAAIIPRPCSTT